MQPESSDLYENLLNLGLPILVLIIIYLSYKINSYRRLNKSFEFAHTPILLSYYTSGIEEMVPLKKGKIGGMNYTAIAIIGNDDRGISGSAALLYMIELPFETKIHLLGIPKKTGAAPLNPAAHKGIMERVDLEGDFNQYFSVFCEKNMQTDSRYVLDPSGMAFSVDFCQSHNWEIVGNDLFFVQGANSKSDEDPTLMFDDIEEFVRQIRPAIARPAKKRPIAHTVHLEKDPEDFRCPRCEIKLINETLCYRCPNGHGIFLLGARLADVKTKQISNQALASQHVKNEAPIHCPACNNVMHKVPYSGSNTIIDSCSHCPFRWLDSGELVRI